MKCQASANFPLCLFILSDIPACANGAAYIPVIFSENTLSETHSKVSVTHDPGVY